jgi:hypothetical protein
MTQAMDPPSERDRSPRAAAPPPHDATALDEWLATHGPLAPGLAIVLALRTCAAATALGDAELSATLPSLHTSGIVRRGGEGWTWVPVRSGGPARTPPDASVIERIGALLFECLAGQPLPSHAGSQQAVLDRLRALRPDLAHGVGELTAWAASARIHPGASLPQFAADLRAAIGLPPRRAILWTRVAAAAAMALLVVATAIAGLARWREPAPGSHGLDADETTLVDMKTENADQLALVDEHTAAIQELQELERVWVRRVDLNDPRLAWIRLRQAWVRQLAGDRLTAEQLLESLVPMAEAALGHRHPYTRTGWLDLADILDARGAHQAATALRADAARAMADVVQSPALAWDSAGVPWPPHTVAHVAPTQPEREGFRLAGPGRHAAPLTSDQRRLAGRDGWHLHVRATSTCRVSLVAGADPRGIGVDVRRGADGAWAAAVEGSSPQLAVASPAADTFALTLSADTDGRLTVRLADGSTHAARVDPTAPPPVPPYALAFGGQPDASACAVVWWEIAAR